MCAMDEMMTANEINMNLAAVTPVVLLGYCFRSVFRFMYYVLLKLGKSREECYASFRLLVLDIERLLLMRDNPPSAPGPRNPDPSFYTAHKTVLGSDDLGMLLLHVHECRVMLWEDRRRFSLQMARDVAEDLAELCGERGEFECWT